MAVSEKFTSHSEIAYKSTKTKTLSVQCDYQNLDQTFLLSAITRQAPSAKSGYP